MSEHSPTPFRAEHSRMGFGSRIWDREGSRVCEVDNDLLEPRENQANAEFIVRAANSHDELLEAARRLLMFAHDVRRTEAISEEEQGFISLAEEAIAKAEVPR